MKPFFRREQRLLLRAAVRPRVQPDRLRHDDLHLRRPLRPGLPPGRHRHLLRGGGGIFNVGSWICVLIVNLFSVGEIREIPRREEQLGQQDPD